MLHSPVEKSRNGIDAECSLITEVRRARKSDTGPSEWDNSQGVIIDNYHWLLYQNVVFLNILRVESATTVSLSWYNRRRKKYRRNSIIAWWKHSKRQLQYKHLELYSRNSVCYQFQLNAAMARQRNQAVFVFFVIMVLFAVSFVFSFPRESRYGLIPRRGMLSVYKLLKISFEILDS